MFMFSHYSLINHQLISFHGFKRLQFTTIIKITSTTNMGTATLTNEFGQVINRQLNKQKKIMKIYSQIVELCLKVYILI